MEQFVCLPFHAERKMCVNLSELERQEWHLPNADAGFGRIFLGSTPWFPIWEQLIPELQGGLGVLVPRNGSHPLSGAAHAVREPWDTRALESEI